MQEDKQIVVAGRFPLTWSPRSLECPLVDPKLTDLHPVVRVAEVLRYSGAKFEYWLSPGGHVREVARLSTLLAALLALPVLLVMPLVTLMLMQVSNWLDLIMKILFDLAAVVVGLAVANYLVRIFAKRKLP